MHRRTFLELAALFGAVPLLPACGTEVSGLYWNLDVNFEGSVIIIGAGAAGLAAGYLLDRYGIEFEIIEASSVFGGRVKRSPDFADFPIDLGAEWIHEDPAVLAELIDDPNVEGSIDLIPFSPDSIAGYHNGRITRFNFGTAFYGEYKFKSTTWYGFLETYIAAGILDRIIYDTPVAEIDYSGVRVRVTDQGGTVREADKVLVTVPMSVLEREDINFTPPWPEAKRSALDSFYMPDGLKVFLEFSEQFYPDITLVGGSPLSAIAQERIYYNAAFRKDTSRNILGLFCVGTQATMYTDAASESEDALISMMLAELDEMFDGRASPTHVGHVVQNWTGEPFIGGSYAHTTGGDEAALQATVRADLDGKVFFAGEALDEDAAATVPGAMRSGYDAVQSILSET